MWVKKLKSGKFSFCERYTDYITGKKKDVSVTFEKNTAKIRKEAQRILAEMISKKSEPEQEDITFERLIDEYRIDQKLKVSPGTYERNYYAAESLKQILGKDVLVNRLTARYVQNKLLQTKKRAVTLNGYLTRFKALIRWGYRADLVESIDFLNKLERFADVPHREKISQKYLEGSELKELLSHMDQPVWKMLTQFLVLSGLRCGEALALENSDIDFDKHVIHVTKTYNPVLDLVRPAKTVSSVDDVTMQPELEDVARKMIQYMHYQQFLYGYRSNLFISDTNGHHVHYYAFNKYLKENTLLYIGKELSTHSLRHTHASLLFEQGFTLDEVARRLRHGDSKITKEIYIHTTKKLKEKDAEKIRKLSLL